MLFKQRGNHGINAVHHFFLRKIKRELISRTGGRFARFDCRVFGMRTEQVAVFVHHFRFEPQPELQALFFAVIDNGIQAAFQLLFVDEPVAQPLVV